jgi:hypothetical protein
MKNTLVLFSCIAFSSGVFSNSHVYPVLQTHDEARVRCYGATVEKATPEEIKASCDQAWFVFRVLKKLPAEHSDSCVEKVKIVSYTCNFLYLEQFSKFSPSISDEEVVKFWQDCINHYESDVKASCVESEMNFYKFQDLLEELSQGSRGSLDAGCLHGLLSHENFSYDRQMICAIGLSNLQAKVMDSVVSDAVKTVQNQLVHGNIKMFDFRPNLKVLYNWLKTYKNV